MIVFALNIIGGNDHVCEVDVWLFSELKINPTGEAACLLQRYQLGHSCQAEGFTIKFTNQTIS